MECAVRGCSNYYRKTIGKNVSYHSFPRNPVYRQKWIDFCRRVYGEPKTNAKICSDHFTAFSYKRDLEHELLGLPSRKRKFLREDAVPTLASKTENSSNENVIIPKKKLRELLPKSTSESSLKSPCCLDKVSLEEKVPIKLTTEYRIPDPQNNVLFTPPIKRLSQEQQVSSQPDAVTVSAQIKVEKDDGSYDINEETDAISKDVIPSALCEVILKPEENSEPLTKTEEPEQATPRKNITVNGPENFSTDIDGLNSQSNDRIVFRTLSPSDSRKPLLVTTRSSELSIMPVATMAAITVPAPKVAATNVPSPTTISEHPLETFFRSMARTVLTFPPHLIAEARMKVCNVVTEIEMRAIKENYSSKESAS